MTVNQNSINIKKSQVALFVLTSLILFVFLLFILSLNINLNIKVLLTFFISFIILFIYNNKTFLYFIFLISPALRVISQKEIIYNQINFNAVLHVFVIIFGIMIFFKHRKYLIKKIKEIAFIKIFLLFLFFASCSLAYSASQTETVNDLIRIYSVFFLFISVLAIVQSKKEARTMLVFITLGSIIPVAVGFWQLLDGSGWYDSSIRSFRIFGTMLHPATFSFFLLSILPINFALLKIEKNKTKKIVYWTLALIFIFLIFTTLTRGAWIAFLFMALIYGLTKNRKAIIWLSLLFLLAYTIIPEVNQRVNDIFEPKYNSSFQTRLNIIKSTLPAFGNNPLLGTGFGSFETVNLKYNDEAKDYESLLAHNDYLKTLIEQGVIGLAVYLFWLLSILKYFLGVYKKTKSEDVKIYAYSLLILWLGAMVIAAGDNMLRTIPVQYVLWSYTAIVISLSSNTKE